MSDFIIVWQDGPLCLACQKPFQDKRYASALIEEVVQIIAAFGGEGEYRLQYETDEYDGKLEHGLMPGPVFIDNHCVRLFFHDLIGNKRPTYELELPDEISLREFAPFLKRFCQDRDEDGTLRLPKVTVKVVSYGGNETPTISQPTEMLVRHDEIVQAFIEHVESELAADSSGAWLSKDDALVLLELTLEELGITTLDSDMGETFLTDGVSLGRLELSLDGFRLPDVSIIQEELVRLQELAAELSKAEVGLLKSRDKEAELNAAIVSMRARLEALQEQLNDVRGKAEEYSHLLGEHDRAAVAARIKILQERLAQ